MAGWFFTGLLFAGIITAFVPDDFAPTISRATAIYLATIAGTSVISGLLLDRLYVGLDISPTAALGQAGEIIPEALKAAATVLLVILSFKPVSISLKNAVLSIFSKLKPSGKN